MTKFEIVLITAKATIKFVVGVCTPLGVSIGTLAAAGKPATKYDIALAVIGGVVGGANAMDGFLSSSFGNFLKKFGLNGTVPPTGDTQMIEKK